MKKKILIIGSGGREHAISWKLKQSPRVGKLFIAPGNYGTSQIGENESLDITNHKEIINFCKSEKIDLVVVTPDDPLAAGLVNDLKKARIRAFGPTREAAQIEASKVYAKKLMQRAGVPTARFKSFSDFKKALVFLKTQKFPCVLKASGLALGKGVTIAKNILEAQKVLEEVMVKKVFGAAGRSVVIEEYLEGTEISIHAFCDGKSTVLFPSSQDHKQIHEGDNGPNTGGMGTIAPVPWVSAKLLREIKTTIVEPILATLKKEGREFKGILYPGLMITKDGPKVLEFNARFGDPETQSYMRLLKSDLWEIFESCIDGTLNKIKISWRKNSACCIVLASNGYPASSTKGIPITGLDKLNRSQKIVVFHAGTKLVSDKLVTNGGRVLGVAAVGATLNQALRAAYGAIKKIHFAGMQYRRDIGRRKLSFPT